MHFDQVTKEVFKIRWLGSNSTGELLSPVSPPLGVVPLVWGAGGSTSTVGSSQLYDPHQLEKSPSNWKLQVRRLVLLVVGQAGAGLSALRPLLPVSIL